MNIFNMDTYKIKKLVDHAHDLAQHDAIMTELATVNAEEAGLFLNGLLSRGEREPTLKVLLTLLAADSLLHIKKVAASTEKNVLQQLSKIVPPRKAAQAREMASAGDLAVVPIERYLARRGKDLDKPCAYCVRTLALIGSPAALKVLEIYAQALCPPHSSAYRTGYAKGGEVYAELLHALPHFNRQEYLQRVLARYLRTAETLLLDGAYDLEGVPPPPALHTVEWWNTGKLGDLRPLAAWPQLCQVTLSDCFGLRDVKALTALPTLRRLHLHRTDPGRLKGFSELRNLERLSLENTGSEKKSLECIAQLTGLQALSLSSWHLEDISALKSLTNLRELWLQGGPNLKDISVIGRLPELKQLSIGEINPQQLCEIPGLARLEQLELNGCQIKKLTGLGRLTGLRTLSMRGSSDLQHVSGLEELMNLQTLSISDCPQLQHLSGIENLVNLQTLEITGREANQLSEMSPLGSLTNLRTVDLRACQNLKKVDGLPQLLALESLNCPAFPELRLDTLSNLHSLTLWRCDSLKAIDELPESSRLEALSLNCPTLREIDLSTLARLSNLRSLSLWGCSNLRRISGLSELSELESLSVQACPNLQGIDLSGLTSLHEVTLWECDHLEWINGLQELINLKALRLQGSLALTKIDLDTLPHLRELTLWWSRNLELINGLSMLHQLESLRLGGSAIRELNLGSLTNLREVSLWKCENLEELDGLRELRRLEALELDGCESLRVANGLRSLPGPEKLLLPPLLKKQGPIPLWS